MLACNCTQIWQEKKLPRAECFWVFSPCTTVIIQRHLERNQLSVVGVLKASESRLRLLIFVNADEILSSITSLFVREDQKAFHSRLRLIWVSLIILEFDSHVTCTKDILSASRSLFSLQISFQGDRVEIVYKYMTKYYFTTSCANSPLLLTSYIHVEIKYK
jgi:hypothetical protein